MSFDPKIVSKFLSYVLRHKPEAINLKLDLQGWASIDELLSKSEMGGVKISRDNLLQLVFTNDKNRFVVSEDGEFIRASQGHSINVELGLLPQTPPSLLFHGTADRFIESILLEGIKPKSRQFVHLSLDPTTAQSVGKRHGQPVILKIKALSMYENGLKFLLAENGVWLTDQVPPEYLTL